MRKFECQIDRISDEWWPYEAETRGKARYKCLRAAWGANYMNVSFKDVRVRIAK